MRSSSFERILFVLQSTAVGGMETHVIDLAGEFRRRGKAVAVAVPTGPVFDEIEHRLASLDVAAMRLDMYPRPGSGSRITFTRELVSAFRALRPDVVHVHTGGAVGGLPAALASKTARAAALVLTEHEVPRLDFSRKHRAAKRLMNRLCDAVIAVSRRNASIRAERFRAHRRLAVVLNGVPHPPADLDERADNRRQVRGDLNIGPEDVVIGTLCRLAPGKGLDDLLRAFSRVPIPSARLLLVGDGPSRAEFEGLATSLGVGGRVLFAGHQFPPAPYLDAMDVFALAVPEGSMSIALLEAMGRGLPPVITFGGPEEAVIDGQTGLTAKPRDPADLARALSTLAADSGYRHHLAAQAEAHVRTHFSVQRVADDMAEVYLAALRRRGLPARLRAGAPPNPRPGASPGTPAPPVAAFGHREGQS